jgi:hypothetical protein
VLTSPFSARILLACSGICFWYCQFIWACDFFTVTTAALRTHYALFFIEIGSRRIAFLNVSVGPDGVWTAQQFRNLSLLDDEPPR